jgi:hypothetical protein
MIKQSKMLNRIRHKIKLGVNIPLKISKSPENPNSVTSDLFPIRVDENWSTEFEFLNLPGLISGDISTRHTAKLIFFNKNGTQIAEREITIHNEGRKTISLKELLHDEIIGAATFAVFHGQGDKNLEIGKSFIAERGYTGYKLNSMPVKGYVHGNLDAISYYQGKIQKLGNFGIQKKIYFFQHLLSGPAEYDFYFTNPTKKRISISPIIEINESVSSSTRILLSSLGCETLSVKIGSEDTGTVKFKSLLYLGRPIVFRKTANSFDVYHG